MNEEPTKKMSEMTQQERDRYEQETDRGAWDVFAAHKAKRQERNRGAIYNTAKKMKLLDRIEMINLGTCLLDGRVYYYAQKKIARVKGQKRKYQMRGVEHFFKVFSNNQP